MRPPIRTLVRYAGLALAGILGLALVVALGVLIAGEWKLTPSEDIPAHPVAVPTDSAAAAEGGRLARVWGCRGCHDRSGGGEVWVETALGDRIVAPNLTRVVREYDAAELERAIRHGVGPDGRTVMIMPAGMFHPVSDADLGKVIAHLRSLPAVPDTVPRTRFGLMARALALLGRVPVIADRVDHGAAHGPSPDSLGPASTRTDTLTLGRYIARTACTECHGPDLRGDGRAPDLRIAAAYAPATFRRLAREGVALDGEERELMTTIARSRMAFLTDDEVAALHAYLSTLAD